MFSYMKRQNMREYVEKTLHTRVDCEPVDASAPLYLRGLYSLER